jgi:hypothetical protein
MTVPIGNAGNSTYRQTLSSQYPHFFCRIIPKPVIKVKLILPIRKARDELYCDLTGKKVKKYPEEYGLKKNQTPRKVTTISAPPKILTGRISSGTEATGFPPPKVQTVERSQRL